MFFSENLVSFTAIITSLDSILIISTWCNLCFNLQEYWKRQTRQERN
jgi:hypothetical protein